MMLAAARVLAVAIAVLAVVDPAVAVKRVVRPIISISHARTDEALAGAVADALAGQFTVVRGTSDAAVAAVVVGGLVPDERPAEHVPVFGVWPRSTDPRVRISRIEVPPVVSLHSRVPLDVQTIITQGHGRSVALEVISDGVVRAKLDTLRQSDSSAVVLRPELVAAAGPQLLQVVARVAGASGADTAHVLVDGRQARFPVLFFDAHPTWHSAFVRRAIERDARFSVSHRVVTSRGLANTAGRAPVSLADSRALREFDVVVVGAPESLGAAEVRGLELFMREHGGRVILLMDNRTSAAIDRLTGVSAWRSTRSVEPVALRNETGAEVLRGRELFVPQHIQSDAEPIAWSERDSTRHTAVWSVPVGAGRVTVSGAGDSWHNREQGSGFERFWASTIAGQAQQSPDAIDIQFSRRVLAPGEETTALVTIRDAYLSNSARPIDVSAALVSESDSSPVRLWPDDAPGTFRSRIIAPRQAAVYRLVVTSGSDRSDAAVAVEPAAALRGTIDRGLLGAWVSSRGGTVVDEQELRRLPSLIASAIVPVPRVETWHPMRSAWWIVPFALLLGAEWFARRRRGLP